MKQGWKGCRRNEASRGRENLKTPQSRGRQARHRSLPASASAVGHQTPWKGHLTPRTARSRGDRSTLQQQRAGRTTLARGRAPHARRKPSQGWAPRVGRVARLRARARDGCEEQGRERGGAFTCAAERPTERRSRRSRELQPHSRRTECSTGGHTRNVRAIRHSRLLERDTGNLETEHPNARRTVLLTQVGGEPARGFGRREPAGFDRNGFEWRKPLGHRLGASEARWLQGARKRARRRTYGAPPKRATKRRSRRSP